MKRINRNRYCKTFLLYILLWGSAYSQINLPFVKYLSDNNFQREYLAYIKSIAIKNSSSDSIAYLNAKYYLQYKNDSLFYSYFLKSKPLFVTDTCAFTKANIYFLTSNRSMQNKWYGIYDTTQTNYFSRSIFDTWLASSGNINIGEKKIPQKLRSDYLKYKKYAHRSPLLAGALSVAVPGLGKLYAGRKQSCMMTLLSHIGFGAQTYEAISKLGMRNPFTIFSMSFFGIFYVANIYGSYHDMKDVKIQTRKQFLIDASDYYTVNSSCGFY